MNHLLNEAKIGDLFHITDREGESHDAFFVGTYKKSGDESITIYNFLYWNEFSQDRYERLPNASKGYKWQTLDFFTYKEDIIRASGRVPIMDYSIFRSPLMWYFSGDFSIKEPWIALCGYQFETSDINTLLNGNSYLDIVRLEEANATPVLRQPVLPKRKEVIIYDEY